MKVFLCLPMPNLIFRSISFMYADTGTHEHARLKTITLSHRQGYRIRSQWKDQRLRCGVFKFLILVLCLNHQASTNPPWGCRLFLSATPFNPLGMVLSKFHSEDNVILQICADAPVFSRLHFSCCLDLCGGSWRSGTYKQSSCTVMSVLFTVWWQRITSTMTCRTNPLLSPNRIFTLK